MTVSMTHLDYATSDLSLYFGDCLKRLAELPDNSVDLVITDPPYEIKNTKAGGSNALRDRFNKAQQELTDLNTTEGFDPRVLDELVRVCRGINMYFFCNKAQIPMYIDYFVTQRGCAFDLIKWVKTNAPPAFNNKYLSDTEYVFYARKNAYCNPENYRDGSTLYHAPANVKDKRMYTHPTPKPVELLGRLVRNSSKQDQTVLDPFMGCGSTGEAALTLSRRFIGMELVARHYCTSFTRLTAQ